MSKPDPTLGHRILIYPSLNSPSHSTTPFIVTTPSYLYCFYILTFSRLAIHLVTNSSSSKTLANKYTLPILFSVTFIHILSIWLSFSSPFFSFEPFFSSTVSVNHHLFIQFICPGRKPRLSLTSNLSFDSNPYIHQKNLLSESKTSVKPSICLHSIHPSKQPFYLSPVHPLNLLFDSNPYHRSKEPSF